MGPTISIPSCVHCGSKSPEWEAGVLDVSLGSVAEFLNVLPQLFVKFRVILDNT